MQVLDDLESKDIETTETFGFTFQESKIDEDPFAEDCNE